MLSYAIFFLVLVGIYGVLVLGLNLQWGYAGMFNIGVGAFFAVGAYASAIVTTPATPEHLGGFGLPFWVGFLMALAAAGLIAFFIGLITLKLRSDYLAIATIGIAEIISQILRNEGWLTNGVRGITRIPRPFRGWIPGQDTLLYLGLVLLVLLVVYWGSEQAYRSPWGRVLRAIREDELAAMAVGKNVLKFRLQAFVLGSMVMGLAGALYAHFVNFISPEAFQPEFATFIVWVMLIAGGSGNNRGALLGALVIWGVWSGTELLTNRLPAEWTTRAGPLRILLIGILLQVILLTRSQGLLPERPPKPILLASADQRQGSSPSRDPAG
ncbi:MAG: branched-chain amino acid ABC transporter permease [Cyanobacteriota bacterium]